MNNSKSSKKLRILVYDALLIAIFVLLSAYLKIEVSNVKITLAALPIILSAFFLGTANTVIIAVIGEFLFQLLSYGITPTMPFWMFPGILRGILLCVLIGLFKRKYNGNIPSFKTYEYAIIIFVTAIIVLISNTAVIAFDAIIYHYYSNAYVFGNLFFRFLAMCFSCVVYTVVTKTLVDRAYNQLHI